MAYLGDGYQWAISLSVEEWAQARYLLGDTSSGVQGQPFIFIFEGIGLALGQVTLAVEVVDPMFTYNSWRTSFVDRPRSVESLVKSRNPPGWPPPLLEDRGFWHGLP